MKQIKMRVVAGQYPGQGPFVLGATDLGTYEVIDPDEWDKMVRRWKEDFDPTDHMTYDWREVTISVPREELASVFQHEEISGSVTGG